MLKNIFISMAFLSSFIFSSSKNFIWTSPTSLILDATMNVNYWQGDLDDRFHFIVLGYERTWQTGYNPTIQIESFGYQGSFLSATDEPIYKYNSSINLGFIRYFNKRKASGFYYNPMLKLDFHESSIFRVKRLNEYEIESQEKFYAKGHALGLKINAGWKYNGNLFFTKVDFGGGAYFWNNFNNEGVGFHFIYPLANPHYDSRKPRNNRVPLILDMNWDIGVHF